MLVLDFGLNPRFLMDAFWKMLVLEVWIVNFCWKSRGKCTLWKRGFSFFGGNLVENGINKEVLQRSVEKMGCKEVLSGCIVETR